MVGGEEKIRVEREGGRRGDYPSPPSTYIYTYISRHFLPLLQLSVVKKFYAHIIFKLESSFRVFWNQIKNGSISFICIEAIGPLLELVILSMTKAEPICIEERLKNRIISSHFR